MVRDKQKSRHPNKRDAATATLLELPTSLPPDAPNPPSGLDHAGGLDEDAARQFAETWVLAWNSRDLDAIMAHYTRRVRLTSPLVARRFGPDGLGTLYGKEKLREYFDIGLRAVPDLHFELRHVLNGPDGVALVYARENGALAVETFRLSRKGKVKRVRVYYHGLPELPPD
jgi:hypothetical protein